MPDPASPPPGHERSARGEFCVAVPARMDSERRSASQIQAHYEIERQLAARLRSSTQTERRRLYPELYDELLRRVGSHPLLHATDGEAAVAAQLRVLERYLDRDAVFLEIGAGDCALALAVAERVRRVYAIDVSAEITAQARRRHPENVDIIVTDGFSIPVPEASVSVAYSDQLFEHLHPDDVLDHLRQVYAALKLGGRYICLTPNRLTGPHDISKYFDAEPTGFHLREYTAAELGGLMRTAGFARVELWTTRRGISFGLPSGLVHTIERAVELLPHKQRRSVGGALPLRVALGCYTVAVKEASSTAP
jgi:SAM-dependent methyltransferase